MNDTIQNDWNNYYDIEFYCSDGQAHVNAYELEIGSDGGIQMNGSKWHTFTIPLEARHTAMLAVFFDDRAWSHTEGFDWDEEIAEKWQDFVSVDGDDALLKLIKAGMEANDKLAHDLAGWAQALPQYTLADHR